MPPLDGTPSAPLHNPTLLRILAPMSLPPGFLDDLRTRISIADVVGRKVTWDSRKSNPGKGDYWAPCPFHQEKTASFHVEDRKGFYYCFGCHAKGDALTFVRETENLGFMEAVELLAAEAGLKMPARDPEAAKRAEARKGLADVMEQAVQFYRLSLKTAAGQAARDYIAKRGLPEATQTRFEIGFAPPNRTALFEHLTAKGIPAADLDKAGLCVIPEDGGQPYDRFRDRIIFPIRNARGDAIALGGRAMDPNARAKYLNSPETPLFDKGRSLYNHGPAREAAGKTGRLIVAEGYMDVIALAQAGFDDAVAPLGTAITEDQLALLWRMTDEPVIALDGDKAGLRAAMRLVDLALPMLVPGKSLRFCLLPQGLDPDDLIKAKGPAAMADLIERAEPLINILWRKETEDRSFDTPERRAALDATLRASLARIPDAGLRNHYTAAIRELRADLFRPKGRDRGRPWSPRAPQGPAPATRASLLAQPSTEAEARIRESILLAGCLNHPDLAEEFESDLEALPFACPDLDKIRTALLQSLPDAPDSRVEAMERRLGFAPAAKLAEVAQVRLTRSIHASAPTGDARRTVSEAIARQRAVTGHAAEVRDAEEEVSGVTDEGLTWRLAQASHALHGAADAESAGSAGDKTMIRMANGLTVSKSDKDNSLKAFEDAERILKRKPE